MVALQRSINVQLMPTGTGLPLPWAGLALKTGQPKWWLCYFNATGTVVTHQTYVLCHKQSSQSGGCVKFIVFAHLTHVLHQETELSKWQLCYVYCTILILNSLPFFQIFPNGENNTPFFCWLI